MAAMLIKRNKEMYAQAFCDAGIRQHSTVMGSKDLRDLKNKYGYRGTKFIKKFLEPFGIKGDCETGLRPKLKANSLRYAIGSYMKIVRKEPKKLRGPLKEQAKLKARLTKIVETVVISAVVEDFEQTLLLFIESLLELLRWQPGTTAIVMGQRQQYNQDGDQVPTTACSQFCRQHLVCRACWRG